MMIMMHFVLGLIVMAVDYEHVQRLSNPKRKYHSSSLLHSTEPGQTNATRRISNVRNHDQVVEPLPREERHSISADTQSVPIPHLTGCLCFDAVCEAIQCLSRSMTKISWRMQSILLIWDLSQSPLTI